MSNVKKITEQLIIELLKINDRDELINSLNEVRKELHQISPFKNHPVDFVEWVKEKYVFPNDYNPNHVAHPEMKLLVKSITEDGFTMPIPNDNSESNHRIIVDGFHRFTCGKTNDTIKKSVYGYLPLSNIREENKGKEKRMASTIRHNRARGTHSIELMTNIVSEITKAGMSDAWIIKNIGMDADELLRLKQISGLAELFKNNEFSIAKEI